MPEINQVYVYGKYLFFQGTGITALNGIIEGEFTGFRYLIADYRNYAPSNSIVLVIVTQVELERWVTIEKTSHGVGCPTGKRNILKIDLLDSEYFKNSISYFINSTQQVNFDLSLTLIP